MARVKKNIEKAQATARRALGIADTSVVPTQQPLRPALYSLFSKPDDGSLITQTIDTFGQRARLASAKPSSANLRAVDESIVNLARAAFPSAGKKIPQIKGEVLSTLRDLATTTAQATTSHEAITARVAQGLEEALGTAPEGALGSKLASMADKAAEAIGLKAVGAATPVRSFLGKSLGVVGAGLAAKDLYDYFHPEHEPTADEIQQAVYANQGTPIADTMATLVDQNPAFGDLILENPQAAMQTAQSMINPYYAYENRPAPQVQPQMGPNTARPGGLAKLMGGKK